MELANDTTIGFLASGLGFERFDGEVALQAYAWMAADVGDRGEVCVWSADQVFGVFNPRAAGRSAAADGYGVTTVHRSPGAPAMRLSSVIRAVLVSSARAT